MHTELREQNHTELRAENIHKTKCIQKKTKQRKTETETVGWAG